MSELFYYEMEGIKFRAKYEKVVELLDKLKSDGATLLEVANGLRLLGGFKKRLTFSQRLHLKDYPFLSYDIFEPCGHDWGEPFREICLYSDKF